MAGLLCYTLNHYPGFKSNQEMIRQVSYGIIFYIQDGQIKQDSYVIFDSYKRVAADITTCFGREKYKEAFIGVEVHTRNCY